MGKDRHQRRRQKMGYGEDVGKGGNGGSRYRVKSITSKRRPLARI